MVFNRRSLMVAGAAAMTSGCISTQFGAPPAQTVSFESLIRQIKHDVGTYIFNHQNDPDEALTGRACGGQVSFAIQYVKLTVTATADQSASASAGLQVPLNLVTIGAGGQRSRVTRNTLTTTLTIWPLTAIDGAEFEDESYARQQLRAIPPPSPEFTGTPINDTLERLRADLLETSDTPPCFGFGQGEGNSIKWAFSVTDELSADGKLSLLIFSAGAQASTATTFANTIEVGFTPSGIGFG